jgi:hypothetical protein
MGTAPYQQHHYLGEFASDALATANVVTRGWDLAGAPRPGMTYYNTVSGRVFFWNGSAWIVDPGCDKGNFDIVGQIIGPVTEYIHIIALSSADFKQGFLVLYIPLSAPYAARRRQCAFIMFGTSENDAMSKAGGKDIYQFRDYYGVLYTFDNWYQKGFMYAVDGLLSDDQYSVSTANIRIKRCWIDGSNLKVSFLNTHGSLNATLTVSGRFHVHR